MSHPDRFPFGRLLVLAAVVIVVSVACGATSGSPGQVSDEPAAPGSASASAAPPPASGDAVTLQLAAANLEYQPGSLSVAAGVPFTVHFRNGDDGIPHNVVLFGDAGFTTKLAESEVVTGRAELDLPVDGLAAGEYRFSCSIHPNMQTSLTVAP